MFYQRIIYWLVSYLFILEMLHVRVICKLHCFLLGGRTSAEIVNWLKKKTGPPAVSVTNKEHAAGMIEKDEVVVLGFFKVIIF